MYAINFDNKLKYSDSNTRSRTRQNRNITGDLKADNHYPFVDGVK